MEEIKVFEKCPEYQSEHFYIRQMKMTDADELFQCYSNPKAAKYFNGDCCSDDFYYTDYSKFQMCMEYWEERYRAKDFVRFTILNREKEEAIGMIEICPSYKYSADGFCMGILRMDLRPEYEIEEAVQELLNLILENVYSDFGVKSVIIKAQEYAHVRRKALKKLHFVSAKEECNISFNDYFIRY